jgi:FixJ family two-component response regulator
VTAAFSSATPIVSVVDDDIPAHESLESVLRSASCLPGTFATAQEFLIRPRSVVPSRLVLEASLPDFYRLGPQESIPFERTDRPITRHGDVATSVQAMKTGAVDFLVKPFKAKVLSVAIREGLDRGCIALAREMEMHTLRNRYASLTRRERQVLALVVSGALIKQIAGEFGISEITVKAHRRRMMQKMQARSFADLLTIATRLGPHRALNLP